MGYGQYSNDGRPTLNNPHGYRKVKRVSNSEMGALVKERIEFTNAKNSCYAKWIGDQERYVVFSYGDHFPIYIWDSEMGWIGNKDKYSVTTTQHQHNAAPHSYYDPTTSPITWLGIDEMKAVARDGWVKTVINKFPAACRT